MHTQLTVSLFVCSNSRAVMESDGASGLPHVPPRQPTEFAPFHLSETNAPPPAPAAEEQAFHFTAR